MMHYYTYDRHFLLRKKLNLSHFKPVLLKIPYLKIIAIGQNPIATNFVKFKKKINFWEGLEHSFLMVPKLLITSHLYLND